MRPSPSPGPSQQDPSKKSKVLIFGSGNFGSCLADHLGDSQHDVYMWSREESFVKHFNLHHRNPQYLTDHHFSPNIQAVGPDLPGQDLLDRMDVLLFAIPTQGLRLVSLVLSLSRDNITQGNSYQITTQS
jgi:glycerol-3-phosphate dehydrogenase